MNKMIKRILHLNLKKKWFYLIAQGKKKAEYRLITPYWKKRLFGDSFKPISKRRIPINFDEVHFRNGYNNSSPFMRIKWEGIGINWFEGRRCYAIQLGKVLEIKNWKTARGKYLCKKHGYLVGHPNKEVILIGGGRLKENDK